MLSDKKGKYKRAKENKKDSLFRESFFYEP
jgi:hypothetical protein